MFYKGLFIISVIINLLLVYWLYDSNENVEQINQQALGQYVQNNYNLQTGLEAALEQNEVNSDWIESLSSLSNFIYGNFQQPILIILLSESSYSLVEFNTSLTNTFSEMRIKSIKGNLSDEDIAEINEIALVLKDFNEIAIGNSIENLSSKEIRKRLEEAELTVIEPYLHDAYSKSN